MKSKDVIELGDRVCDEISGFTGIVIAKTDWLYSCERIVVAPESVDKDGKLHGPESFDVMQCMIIDKGVMRPNKDKGRIDPKGSKGKTGGPQPMPTRHPDPRR